MSESLKNSSTGLGFTPRRRIYTGLGEWKWSLTVKWKWVVFWLGKAFGIFRLGKPKLCILESLIFAT